MNSLRKIDALYHLAEPLSPHPSVPVNISHKTPFAPHGNASETSSVVYIPPTGAPGYRGEGYDWDVGVLVEKKAPYVDLKGRREGTVRILDVNLANMVGLQPYPCFYVMLSSVDSQPFSRSLPPPPFMDAPLLSRPARHITQHALRPV